MNHDPISAPDLPVVQTHALSRHFGNMVALDKLNLTIEKGDLFGFIGSNGAGKTTTLRILATFLAPSSGHATILGHNVIKEPDAVRHLIGYMPDFFGVYKDMEVTEYLDFFAACYRIDSKQRESTVSDVLELVGLTEKKGALIGALSRGMQQRIGLARVLIHDPQLLLLDEPASGLDPRARIEMMAILQELQQMGKTIIISSHILSELQNLCNRVAIIEQGKLIYSGDVEGVAKQLSRDRVILASIQGDWEKAIGYLKARSEIADVQWDKDRLRITMADHQSNVGVIAQTLVANQIDLLSLTEDQLGLEEVFMRVTRGDTQ